MRSPPAHANQPLPRLFENGRLFTLIRMAASAGNIGVLLTAGTCGALAVSPMSIPVAPIALFGLFITMLSLVNLALLFAHVESRRRRNPRRVLAAVNFVPAVLVALVLCLEFADLTRVLVTCTAALFMTLTISAIAHWWPRVRAGADICHLCGYDLQRIESSTCPECGAEGALAGR